MTPGDELNVEDRDSLQRYLHAQFSPADEFAIVEFEVLAGGVSGRTVRVKLAGGQEWVLKQALAKLRVQADWFSDPRRIHREALGMQVLGELCPAGSIPKLIFDDEQHHVLAMEAVPQPHENWKTMLLAGRVDDDSVRQFAELLGSIHRKSWRRRDEFSRSFEDRSFFESLRLEPYYLYGAEQEPRAREFFHQLVAVSRATQIALVHGDFSPKNVLIHGKRIVLLDHEVIHWGDPAFDVGFAMSHLLSKMHHLQRCRADLVTSSRLWWHTYEQFTSSILQENVPVSQEQCVRHTLGCLLARVVGRSPLEYLTSEERDNQQEACVRLILDVPRDVPDLIVRFVQEIER